MLNRSLSWLCLLPYVVLMAMILTSLLFGHAHAQGIGVGSNDDVQLRPWVEIIQPFIVDLVPPIIAAIAAWAAYLFKKYTGIQIQSDAINRLKSAAQTQAGKIIAAEGDRLAGKSISVGDPRIVAAANWMAGEFRDSMAKANATPELLQHFVQSELGKIAPPSIVAVTIPAPK